MSVTRFTIVKGLETHPANMRAAFAVDMIASIPFFYHHWTFGARLDTKCFLRLIAKNVSDNLSGLITRLARMRAVTKCANGHQTFLACKCNGALAVRRRNPVDLVTVGCLAVFEIDRMATNIRLERFLKHGLKRLSRKMLLDFRKRERLLADFSAGIGGFHAAKAKLP